MRVSPDYRGFGQQAAPGYTPVVNVAVRLPVDFADGAEFLADVRALEAAGAEVVEVEGGDAAVLGAVAAVTHRMRLFVQDASAAGTLQRLSRGRVIASWPEGETWARVPMPPDRNSWMRMLNEREAAQVTGVIVDWDPRLIDLLRNPEPEDRSDLLMSTG